MSAMMSLFLRIDEPWKRRANCLGGPVFLPGSVMTCRGVVSPPNAGGVRAYPNQGRAPKDLHLPNMLGPL